MQDILIILFRMVVSYLLLLILMKFMGKREIGQLSLFDLLILLTIVNIMVLGIEDHEENFWNCLAPMIGIAVIQKIVALICLKWPIVRTLMDGTEVAIIIEGQLCVDNMRKQRYNMDDLFVQLREKNIRTIEEVEYAILENNGKLSVFLYSDDENKIKPFPVIVSGRLMKKNLEILKLSEEWVNKELKRQGYNSVKQIYGAMYDGKTLRIAITKTSKS